MGEDVDKKVRLTWYDADGSVRYKVEEASMICLPEEGEVILEYIRPSSYRWWLRILDAIVVLIGLLTLRIWGGVDLTRTALRLNADNIRAIESDRGAEDLLLRLGSERHRLRIEPSEPASRKAARLSIVRALLKRGKLPASSSR